MKKVYNNLLLINGIFMGITFLSIIIPISIDDNLLDIYRSAIILDVTSFGILFLSNILLLSSSNFNNEKYKSRKQNIGQINRKCCNENIFKFFSNILGIVGFYLNIIGTIILLATLICFTQLAFGNNITNNIDKLNIISTVVLSLFGIIAILIIVIVSMSIMYNRTAKRHTKTYETRYSEVDSM